MVITEVKSLLLVCFLALSSAALQAGEGRRTDIPVPQLSAQKALATAQSYLANLPGTMVILALEWRQADANGRLLTCLPSNAIWYIDAQTSSRWSWYVTYGRKSDTTSLSSSQIGVFRISDQQKIERLVGVGD